MRLPRFGFILALPLSVMSLAACEEEGGGEATPPEGAAAPAPEAAAPGAAGAPGAPAAAPAEAEPAPEPPKPDAACTALIEAIKAKNVEATVAASTDGAADAINKKSIKGMAKTLGKATCGEAKVEGDTAVVTATAGKKTHEIPFKLVENAWKFDAAAYTAKPAKGADEKGGKKKKKKQK